MTKNLNKREAELASNETMAKGRLIRNQEEQVAQGQYVVSDTRCPALHDCEIV